MRLQIDTVQKVIRIEDRINLGELISTLAAMFPDEQWKEYSLESMILSYPITSPITIGPSDPLPWIQPGTTAPWITQPGIVRYDGVGNGGMYGPILKTSDETTAQDGIPITGQGVFNIEING